MKILKKIASAIATGALLLNTFAIPAFATTITISGNGSSSENEVEVKTEQETTVVQNNNADIYNDVRAESETGNNSANDNTGGDVAIKTGNAVSNVSVTNQANSNTANIENCGTCNGSADVKISGNGSNSENEVELEKENETSVYQDNNADIYNDVRAESETGGNDANRNTGSVGGSAVSITTGNATTGVTIKNQANANLANIGGNNNGSSVLNAEISGNGSGSENEIELDLDRSAIVVQDNNAYFDNDIKAEAETGENDANDNTGSDITVKTGNADSTVDIDNMANFNAADVDCCITDLSAKISGNGSDSENEIEAELENELEVYQENCGDDLKVDSLENGDHSKCELKNDVNAEAETGDNDADRNTDPTSDAVTVTTGDATQDTTISNQANANIFGQGQVQEVLEGVNLTFDLSDLLSALHIS